VTGQRTRFRSVILPPWCRKSPKVAEVLPLLYLHGLSTGDFVAALEGFFGSGAGLSAPVITRLVAAWQADYQAFGQRDLAERDYVYCWADGVHFRVRLEQARLCCLVIVGVRADGTKELVAVCDGERESTQSWAELLRDLRRRGMRAPMVMVGDGALGLWAALRDVFPATRHQRDWVHKTANVLADPRRARPRPGPPCHRGVRPRLRRQVAQGGGQDLRRRRGAAVLLRLPGRALAAPQDQQPDRVDLLHGQAQDPGDQGARLQGPGAGDGVSSCWPRPSSAGGRSTARTWSRWCGPAPASTRG